MSAVHSKNLSLGCLEIKTNCIPDCSNLRIAKIAAAIFITALSFITVTALLLHYPQAIKGFFAACGIIAATSLLIHAIYIIKHCQLPKTH